MSKFVCLSCKSSELSFEKFVYCEVAIIIHSSGHIEYADSKIDEDNAFGVGTGYICHRCKQPLILHGSKILTEHELIEYLNMTLDERKEMLADHIAMEEELSQLAEDEGYTDEEIDDTEPEN